MRRQNKAINGNKIEQDKALLAIFVPSISPLKPFKIIRREMVEKGRRWLLWQELETYPPGRIEDTLR